ncbi:cardiolipin synthase (CMP-forming), mitochondrial-like [Iris pallida]|uniref:Cardiolipin synthase (CMP-forming), mitochondrial-like n=1 Tax=Iris pallida TaxID=29817 RepID=A0AAX6GRL0_IRIPA|nr:cardiolipin synthase (CMP-forming), mitochondrial-like [Iris pallida]KAJ6831409.1 cardiolipin synthase (CMP-forming), mitochondrial-like [Iris pallida]
MPSLLKTAVTFFPFRPPSSPSLLRTAIAPKTSLFHKPPSKIINISRRDISAMPKRWAGGDGIRADAMSSSSSSSSIHHQNGINGSYSSNKKHEEEEEEEEEDDRGRKSKLLTLPTVLTLGRVAAVPILVATFNMNGGWATTATTSIFLAAAVTDWLDGYLARKMGLGTAFGAFLDPVADKLMVAATLMLLCSRPLEVGIFGEVPWLLTVPSIVIIGREITMSAVREWAASQSSKVLEAVAVNNLGKWKTATQMTALTILLATRDPSLAGQGVLTGSDVQLKPACSHKDNLAQIQLSFRVEAFCQKRGIF